MKTIASRPNPKGMKLVASARFTQDMASNLLEMCKHLEEGETITLELFEWGVWGKTETNVRLFIGAAEPLQEHHLNRVMGHAN
jgi:hypothetical protein